MARFLAYVISKLSAYNKRRSAELRTKWADYVAKKGQPTP